MMNQKQKEEAVTRLKKIEGQVRGIIHMVAENRYCIDLLTQTRAAISAIMKVEDLILYQHLNTCVADSMRTSDTENQKQKITEIMDVFSKYRKSGVS